MSERLKQIIEIALADKEASKELIALLEEYEARIADAEARITVLETP